MEERRPVGRSGRPDQDMGRVKQKPIGLQPLLVSATGGARPKSASAPKAMLKLVARDQLPRSHFACGNLFESFETAV